jgi:hypothetical protein
MVNELEAMLKLDENLKINFLNKTKLKNINLLKKKKFFSFKYYLKNLYFLNYKLICIHFFFLFNFINIKFGISNFDFNKSILKLIKKKKEKNLSFKLKINNYLDIKKILIKNFNKKFFIKKFLNFLFFKKKLKNLKFLPDNLPFLNLLKTHNSIALKLDNLINDYGYIYLKSSGINTFLTLTNSQGNV